MEKSLHPWNCGFCGSCFTSFNELQDHVIGLHGYKSSVQPPANGTDNKSSSQINQDQGTVKKPVQKIAGTPKKINAKVHNTPEKPVKVRRKRKLPEPQEEEKPTKRSRRKPSKKVFLPQEKCKCKNKNCADLIDVNRQKEIFTHFKNLSYSERILYLRNITTVKPVKEHRSDRMPIVPLAQKAFNYKVHLTDRTGQAWKVCQSFYSRCLQVAPVGVRSALLSVESNPDGKDLRGHHPPANRISENVREIIRQFIASIPSYEPRYGAKNSPMKYLCPNLHITKLHGFYKEMCDKNGDNSVKDHIFREIFKKEFNLDFKLLKDSCKKCPSRRKKDNKYIPTREIPIDHDHKAMSDRLRDEFNNDVTTASVNRKVLSFALREPLETPRFSNDIHVTKRKLWTFNLCVYDEGDKKAYMYVWSEDVASNGPEEITSCLLYHLRFFVPPTTTQVVFYSSSKIGRSSTISPILMLKNHLANSNIYQIEHKFHLPGHNYSACDRLFEQTDKVSKSFDILSTPDAWCGVIRNATRCDLGNTFVQLTWQDFVKVKCTNGILSDRSADLKASNIFMTKYSRMEDFSYEVTTYEGEYIKVTIAKWGKIMVDMAGIAMEYIHLQGRSISQMKKNDLIELVQYLDDHTKNFYQNLKVAEENVEDYAYASDEE
ncbi:hypothetical protein DMENIID0001_103870 [Sergentomyia squamirostris]